MRVERHRRPNCSKGRQEEIRQWEPEYISERSLGD
jgi:hypothetical protein